jgi:hypothetical protein
VPIGELLDDIESLIVDEQLREVEHEIHGELVDRAAVKLRYWQDKREVRKRSQVSGIISFTTRLEIALVAGDR